METNKQAKKAKTNVLITGNLYMFMGKDSNVAGMMLGLVWPVLINS